MRANAFRHACIVLSLLVLGSFLMLSPARGEEGPRGGRCLPFQKDLTNPSLADFLGERPLIPISPQRATLLSGGQKISSQTFAVGNGPGKMAAVTITCSARCDATGCSINGCDASASGCSSCWCLGIGGCSSCTCSKTSTYTEAPR
ncbi:MAG: hypothetical protein ACJ75H_03765 [Thermoanaerobaculia bacterium]